MTLTPGQQLDQNTTDLGKLQGKVQGNTEAIAGLYEGVKLIGQLQLAVDDLAARLQELETGLPPIPEPEPEPDPTPDPEPTPVDPEPEPEPPTSIDDLIPGPGWTGPAEQPPVIPGATEACIAHWNVVPEQTIADGFTVGVIAHHLDGVAFVAIQANGGKAVLIQRPTINPQTKCEEYWTTIRNPGDKPIELRAVVYPHKGMPTLVKPLGREYSNQDLTLYPYETGRTITLQPGTHQVRREDLPSTGWLTIKGTRDCIIEDVARDWHSGRLKFQGVSLRLGSGGGELAGRWSSRDKGQHIWFDDCDIDGNGPTSTTHWLAKFWETATYTDCEISHMQNCFDTGHSLVRNVKLHNIYEDTIRVDGLYVNIEITDVDRTPASTSYHPDILQDQNLQNTIIQDLAAVNSIYAQGIFPKDVDGVALVRVRIHSQGDYKPMQIMGVTQNLLIDSCDFQGGTPLFRGSLAPGGRYKIINTPSVEW